MAREFPRSRVFISQIPQTAFGTGNFGTYNGTLAPGAKLYFKPTINTLNTNYVIRNLQVNLINGKAKCSLYHNSTETTAFSSKVALMNNTKSSTIAGSVVLETFPASTTYYAYSTNGVINEATGTLLRRLNIRATQQSQSIDMIMPNFPLVLGMTPTMLTSSSTEWNLYLVIENTSTETIEFDVSLGVEIITEAY